MMIPLAVFIFLPFLTGDWQSSDMTWSVPSWPAAFAWLWLMGWSAYGVEACATFAPEYKDTARDTSLALRSAAIFSLGVYILLPLGLGGMLPQEDIAANPYAFYVPVFDQLVGGASDVMVILLIASLVLSMNTATADGSRALYGIAGDDMTVKQLHHLNRFHVPGRAMTVGHDHQPRARLLRRQHPRDLRRREPRLHPRPRLRAQGVRAPAAGSARLAEADQVEQDLGADRSLTRCDQSVPHGDGCLVHRAHRLRRYEGDPLSASACSASRSCSTSSGGSCRTSRAPHWREDTPTMPDAHVATLLGGDAPV